MNRFLTLFPRSENVHLIKDVGMIPFILHKNLGYDSTLACYKNGSYEYLNNEVEGLKIVFIKKIFHIEILDSLFFLLLNFKKYDILQLYHLQRSNVIIAYLFKILTQKRGLTYLKMDANSEIKKFHFQGSILWYYEFLVKKIDLISIETKELFNYVMKENLLGRNVIYLPNGFYDKLTSSGSKFNKIAFESKQKTIITVGRIGHKEKNNELLLAAFAEIAGMRPEWRLELVGPIVPDFEVFISSFFKKNPHLTNKVVFTGLIADRELLVDRYNEAQIFVLTSPSESFGLVYIEALRAGCYIISSNLPSAHDITDNEKYGKLFPIGDIRALIALLLEATNAPETLNNNCLKAQKFAYDNFDWSVIIQKLDFHLKQCQQLKN